MNKGVDIQLAAQRALEDANLIFRRNRCDIRLAKLLPADLKWCIALQRSQPEAHQLPWSLCGHYCHDPHTFAFSFKMRCKESRPAGACVSQFCPASRHSPAMLNVEMLQNFHLTDSVLDGNTLRFALYAAVLFMAETECEGIRLITPLNRKVADYYISQFGFRETGSMDILFRDAEGLYQWFLSEAEQVEVEQKPGDDGPVLE